MHVRRASLVAAALLAAAPALAQTGTPRAAPMRGSVLLGFEDGRGPAGIALRLDGEIVQRPLSPVVGLSIVGSLGYSHRSDDGADFFGDTWENSLGVFKVIPAARFTFGRNARIRPYADAGIGLFYASWSYTWHETVSTAYPPYYATVERTLDDSEVGLMFRFAGGLTFQVSDAFSIGGEIGFSPYLGDIADDTTFNAMFAAVFRL